MCVALFNVYEYAISLHPSRNATPGLLIDSNDAAKGSVVGTAVNRVHLKAHLLLPSAVQ